MKNYYFLKEDNPDLHLAFLLCKMKVIKISQLKKDILSTKSKDYKFYFEDKNNKSSLEAKNHNP